MRVIGDIKKAIPIIVSKNLFVDGLHWDTKTNSLNKELLISNKDTNLNTAIIVKRVRITNVYRYLFLIKTVMGKKNFKNYHTSLLIRI